MERIACADRAVIVDHSEASADIVAIWSWWQDRVADLKEVWRNAADEALQDNLDESRSNNGVEDTEEGVVAIPERLDAVLHGQDDEHWDEYTDACGGPDWNDVSAMWIGKFWVDDLSILKVDWEVASWRWAKEVNLEPSISKQIIVKSSIKRRHRMLTYSHSQSSKGSQGKGVQPVMLDPISRGRTLQVAAAGDHRVMSVLMAISNWMML